MTQPLRRLSTDTHTHGLIKPKMCAKIVLERRLAPQNVFPPRHRKTATSWVSRYGLWVATLTGRGDWGTSWMSESFLKPVGAGKQSRRDTHYGFPFDDLSLMTW